MALDDQLIRKQIERICVKHDMLELIADIRPYLSKVSEVDNATSDALAMLFAHIVHDCGVEGGMWLAFLTGQAWQKKAEEQ